MARGEYLFGGEAHGIPAGAELPKPRHCPFTTGTRLCMSGNQMCNPLAVTGNGNSLSVLHCPQEFRRPRLGFSGPNLTHNPVPTGCFDYAILLDFVRFGLEGWHCFGFVKVEPRPGRPEQGADGPAEFQTGFVHRAVARPARIPAVDPGLVATLRLRRPLGWLWMMRADQPSPAQSKWTFSARSMVNVLSRRTSN